MTRRDPGGPRSDGRPDQQRADRDGAARQHRVDHPDGGDHQQDAGDDGDEDVDVHAAIVPRRPPSASPTGTGLTAACLQSFPRRRRRESPQREHGRWRQKEGTDVHRHRRRHRHHPHHHPAGLRVLRGPRRLARRAGRPACGRPARRRLGAEWRTRRGYTAGGRCACDSSADCSSSRSRRRSGRPRCTAPCGGGWVDSRDRLRPARPPAGCSRCFSTLNRYTRGGAGKPSFRRLLRHHGVLPEPRRAGVRTRRSSPSGSGRACRSSC